MARSGSEVVFTKPLAHAHSAAVDRYIKDIEVRANGQKRIIEEAKRLREHFDHMMSTRVQQEKTTRETTKEFLVKQMAEKRQRDQQERDQRRSVPDIEGNEGYPRIRELSWQQREEQKQKAYRKVKGDLDSQLKEKREKSALEVTSERMREMEALRLN